MADDNNPFGAFPFLGDIMKSLTGQGPLNWDIARQVAYMSVNGEAANVDPAARIAFEQLAPLAHRHIADFLATDDDVPDITCVTPAQWCHETLQSYRPIFDNLAVALGRRAPDANDASDDDLESFDANDPMTSMMNGLMSAMAPMMLGMTVGSMVGQLAAKAFGQYDLLVPRNSDNRLLFVAPNVDSFAADWNLPLADIRMWVLVHEMAAHHVLRAPHLRSALLDAINAYVSAFSPNPEAVIEKLAETNVDPSNPMAAFQRTMSDPALLLGAVISPEQELLRPRLDALLACTVGLVDWIVDGVTQRLLGGAPAVGEALRRRRVESSPSDRFVEHLLGIHHTRTTIERGRSFIAGIIERSSTESVLDLLRRSDALPTPAEIDAPGLWLARLEIS